MRMEREGHVYPPYRLKPDRALAAAYLKSLGVEEAPNRVPPTYMIFLRGETLGLNLFDDLDIPRTKALHAGQRYEWHRPIGWGDEVEVTATVTKLSEKDGRRGKIWFADVTYDYRLLPSRALALREVTRLVKTS